jgi:hypothetical protein
MADAVDAGQKATRLPQERGKKSLGSAGTSGLAFIAARRLRFFLTVS